MNNLKKILDRYLILSIISFSAPFYYAIFDTVNNDSIFKTIDSIKIINEYIYWICYVIVFLIIILSIIKMKNVARVFSVKKDDKNKIFKVLQLFLIGYFIGTFLGINEIFVKNIFLIS